MTSAEQFGDLGRPHGFVRGPRSWLGRVHRAKEVCAGEAEIQREMVMDGRWVMVEIEYSNDVVTVRKGLSAKEAADVVERLEGESDVTVQISQENIDESLKVAIDCAWAFLGVGP